MPTHIIQILTRYNSTYHAKTGKGKSAYKVSCTAGEKNAAEALLVKYYDGKGIDTLIDTKTHEGDWRVWSVNFDASKAAPAADITPTKVLSKSDNTPTKIKLDTILDTEIGTLQMRTEVDSAHVDELKDCLAELPPITLFADPLTGKHHIGDGWHRFLAHKLSGKKEIAALVHPGGPAEALKHALGANAEHNALRRTNRDKRKAVTIALKSFPKMSLRELGDLCKVSHQFVAIIKNEVSTVDTKPTTASSEKPAPKPAQTDFFAQLNASFKPVEDGLKEVFSHSYFLNPDVLKKDKLEAITGIERSLKAKLQEAKDLKAKLAAQEETVGAELAAGSEPVEAVETAETPAPELATA